MMTGRAGVQVRGNIDPKRKSSFFHKLWKDKYLLFMAIPPVVLVIVFNYFPLYGWTMAFQNFKPGIPLFQQTWVGFGHFAEFLSDKQFYLAMRNTVAMSFLSLVCGFTFPIAFALLLNEIRVERFKRTIQTISYLPHFVSWVVVAGIFSKLLSTDGGVVNVILVSLHIINKPISFLAKPELFWGIVTAADLWKELGWNAIIFLAAMTAIDPELYEAAIADGAGRFRRMWHITLPGIRGTYIVLLIMSIGWFFQIGFEKQYLLGNSIVQDYSVVIDYYALKYGIQMARFSFGTAVGMANSVISLVLIFSVNRISRKIGEGSLW